MRHRLTLICTLTCSAIAGPTLAEPLTVWNQAYQETYQPDSLDSIAQHAQDAYVLLDPFDETAPGGWPAYVAALKARGNQPGAYISIGTAEAWRADFDRLRPALVAQPWEAWDSEYFIKQVDDLVLDVMKARIDRIAALGFIWVEFDNMDWALDDRNRDVYGVRTTPAQSLTYARTLCAHAQAKGLKCMAKSMVRGMPMFDGATYESYPDNMGWWDQDAARDLLARGKPVVIIHYNSANCAGVLDHYIGIYGPEVSVLCETAAANGYVRLARSPRGG